MNVTELARRIKVSPNEMRDLFPRLGYDIGRKAIKVDDAVAHKIIEMVEQDSSIIDQYRREQQPEEEIIESATSTDKQTLPMPAVITVRDFAGLVQKPVTTVIQELMKNGILANLNERIDYETASIIAEDFGYKPVPQDESQTTKNDANTEEKPALGKGAVSRPPIVVVMGHVDHGKTKLLDTIRKANVIASESGGITQHIGAYQAEKSGKTITFIDTPGHQAFTAMRSRGARVADIAILVVAADDGLKPQTEEAIQIIQSAKLPFIVAINKIDKPEADPEKVLNQLAQKNLLPESWGGKIMTVNVSAKTGEGIDALLDSVLLVADVEQEHIMANPNDPAEGTVIESHIDKGEGPVATIIIRNGTLHRGDAVQVGTAVGKVRAMKNHLGKEITDAPPSTPVKLLGLKGVPEVGDTLHIADDEASLKKIQKQLQQKERAYRDTQTWRQVRAASEDEDDDTAKEVHVILKADTLGSQEAILQSLETIHAKDVRVSVVKKGLGNITDVDVLEAESVGARIYGFNVKVNQNAQELADEREVPIRTDSIIYNLIDDVQEQVNALVTYEKVRVDLGRAKVLAIFRTEHSTMIIGGLVTKGKLVKDAKATVLRNDLSVGDVTITELKQGRETVSEIPAGTECGIALKGSTNIAEGDFLDVYTEELKK